MIFVKDRKRKFFSKLQRNEIVVSLIFGVSLIYSIVTVRNSSCGKVMFSQPPVCPLGEVYTLLRQNPPGRHHPLPRRPLQRTIRIPLECVLVIYTMVKLYSYKTSNPMILICLLKTCFQKNVQLQRL